MATFVKSQELLSGQANFEERRHCFLRLDGLCTRIMVLSYFYIDLYLPHSNYVVIYVDRHSKGDAQYLCFAWARSYVYMWIVFVSCLSHFETKTVGDNTGDIVSYHVVSYHVVSHRRIISYHCIVSYYKIINKSN